MHRVLAARHWPRICTSPGSSQLRALHSMQLSPSYLHIAKYTPSTLGADSNGPRKGLMFSVTSRPTINVARCYSSGPRFAKPSSPKQVQSETPQSSNPISPKKKKKPVMDPAQYAQTIAAVDRVKQQILDHTGIPTTDEVLSALLEFHKAVSLATGPSTIQLTGKSTDSDTAASSLLSLDGSSPKPSQPPTSKVSSAAAPGDFVDHISKAAFEVIAHPAVIITQEVLEAYVVTQARLGRVETLPYVLSLYASKPRPRVKSGSTEYVAQDPHTPAAAVPSQIVDKALDAAIEVKDLDAAVGIIENTYGTKAFQRQKILSKTLLPASVAFMLPIAVYMLASKLAAIQPSYDPETATFIAGVGIMGYVILTGSLGMIHMVTFNDQMTRVTYIPGITLRERWLREEQRAAYDKVACSFGFSEPSRFGEEEGEEFQLLRQLLLRRGMMLDCVALMEGMS